MQSDLLLVKSCSLISLEYCKQNTCKTYFLPTGNKLNDKINCTPDDSEETQNISTFAVT